MEIKLSLDSKALVETVLNELDSRFDKYGADYAAHLSMSFLAAYVGAMAYRALMEPPVGNVSKKQHLDFTFDNFSSVKEDVQNSVAAGVSGAMTEFSGQEVHYYCMIRAVPTPVNKEPC